MGGADAVGAGEADGAIVPEASAGSAPEAAPVVEPAGAKAHVFVDDLAAPELDAGDQRHLERVLRIRPGEVITASDGRGAWRPYRFGPTLEAVGASVTEPRPAPEVAVGFALVKGDKPEWIVQKLTELGVDRIVPFAASRSIVRWDAAKVARNHARLVAVAKEAAMQSRRTWLPVVEPVTTFAEVAARPGTAVAERGGRPLVVGQGLVLVGPEGGWSPEELAVGLPRVVVGTQVLRAETAAITVGAFLTGLRAGIVTQGATPTLGD